MQMRQKLYIIESAAAIILKYYDFKTHSAHPNTPPVIFSPYFIPSCHSISLPSLFYSSQINVS